MSQENYFNNINDLDSGIKRVLGGWNFYKNFLW